MALVRGHVHDVREELPGRPRRRGGLRGRPGQERRPAGRTAWKRLQHHRTGNHLDAKNVPGSYLPPPIPGRQTRCATRGADARRPSAFTARRHAPQSGVAYAENLSNSHIFLSPSQEFADGGPQKSRHVHPRSPHTRRNGATMNESVKFENFCPKNQ